MAAAVSFYNPKSRDRFLIVFLFFVVMRAFSGLIENGQELLLLAPRRTRHHVISLSTCDDLLCARDLDT